MLLAGIAARVDAIDLQLLIRGKRRNQLALAGVSVELPAVVAALDLLAVEGSVGKRHAAMRAGIVQGEGRPARSRPRTSGVSSSMVFSSLRAELVARQGAIPEAKQHQGIGCLALEGSVFKHGKVRILQA